MWTYWDSHQRVGYEEFLFPVQNQTAREVSADLYRLDARDDRLTFADELPSTSLIDLAQPLLVRSSQIDWTIEDLCPVKVGRVVMRVADDNRLQSSSTLDPRDSVFVQVADQVPKNVPIGCLKHQTTLTNGELWLRCDGPDPHINLVLCALVGVLFAHLRETRP